MVIKTIKTKPKFIVLIIILVFLLIFYFLIRNRLSPELKLGCQNISDKQAVEIVSRLPEVKKFQNELSKTNFKLIYIPQKTALNWDIRVAENRSDHITTFNYYTIDACNGKILCASSIYDKTGKYVSNSNLNEYPCD